MRNAAADDCGRFRGTRRWRWPVLIGDATRRIVDDSNQARVHHEPVAVGVEVMQVGPRTSKDVEIRLFRRPKDGNERDGFSVVPPDPDDGETQLRSTCGRD